MIYLNFDKVVKLAITVLLFIISGLFESINAQDGIQVRVGSGHDYFFWPDAKKGVFAVPNEKFTLTQNVDVFLFKNKGSRSRFLTGLSYERSSRIAENISITFDALSIPRTTHQMNFNTTTHRLYIPFIYNTFLGRKKRVIIGGGFTQQFGYIQHTKKEIILLNNTDKQVNQSTSFDFDIQSCLQVESGYRFQFKSVGELSVLAYLKARFNPFDLSFLGYTLQPGITIHYTLLKKMSL